MVLRSFFSGTAQTNNEKVLQDMWLTQQNRMDELFQIIKDPHSLKMEQTYPSLVVKGVDL